MFREIPVENTRISYYGGSRHERVHVHYHEPSRETLCGRLKDLAAIRNQPLFLMVQITFVIEQ